MNNLNKIQYKIQYNYPGVGAARELEKKLN